MPLAVTLSAPIFVLLAASGVLGLHKLALDNGLMNSIRDEIISGKALLPGTKLPLRTEWTGLVQSDRLLSLMVMFFTPILDRANLALYLQGLHFYGLLASSWLLVLLETFRPANAGLAASYATLAGLLLEFGGVGLFLPLWALLHVATSPLLRPFASSPAHAAALLPSAHDLHLLPYSFALGFGVPGLLMSLTRPHHPGPASQQLWILVRLFHPLLAVLTHRVLKLVASPPPATQPQTQAQRRGPLPARLKTLYATATALSVASHVAILGFLGVAHFAPQILPVAVQRTPLALRDVWPLVAFWRPAQRIQSYVDGISTFLAWDELLGAATIVVWGVAVSATVAGGFGRVVKAAVVGVVGGPAAAAVFLVRKRDEVVLAQVGEIVKGRKAR